MEKFRDAQGETLIEIMMTITVMAIGMVAVVASLGTLIIGSDVHHGLAQGEVVVRDFGEAIKTKAITASTFTSCPTAAVLTPTGFTYPTGWSATVDTVEWWVPDPSNFPNGHWTATVGTTSDPTTCLGWYTACATTVSGCDAGLQRVTFTVRDSRADYAHAAITGQVLTRRNNA